MIPADCDLSATNRDNETALDIAVRRGDTVLISRIELAARRKGLMNSTWRQKLTENKVILPNTYNHVVTYVYLFS